MQHLPKIAIKTDVNYSQNDDLLIEIIELQNTKHTLVFNNCDFSRTNLAKHSAKTYYNYKSNRFFGDGTIFNNCNFNKAVINISTFPQAYKANNCTWEELVFRGKNDTYILDSNSNNFLLKKVADRVILENGPFAMGDWHQDKNYNSVSLNSHQIHSCETTHCIGGWAEMLDTRGFGLVYKENHFGASMVLLGIEAFGHLHDTQEDGLKYLKEVIARYEHNN